jgi:hypothetical protein
MSICAARPAPSTPTPVHRPPPSLTSRTCWKTHGVLVYQETVHWRVCCCICKLFVDNGHEAGHAKDLMCALHSVHSTTSSDYAVAMRLQVIALTSLCGQHFKLLLQF